MNKHLGFTLVELLVTIAILAILTALAVPSFKQTIQSTTISNNVNTFMGDLRFARSEAIRRGGNVVMCRSNAPEAANPVCNTGSGTGTIGWASGWIIFHDLNNNFNRDAGETILRVQAQIKSIDSMVEAKASPQARFEFTGTGRLRTISSATQLQFGGGNYANTVQRVVCVSLGGRARIAGDGNAACAGGNYQ